MAIIAARRKSRRRVEAIPTNQLTHLNTHQIRGWLFHSPRSDKDMVRRWLFASDLFRPSSKRRKKYRKKIEESVGSFAQRRRQPPRHRNTDNRAERMRGMEEDRKMEEGQPKRQTVEMEMPAQAEFWNIWAFVGNFQSGLNHVFYEIYSIKKHEKGNHFTQTNHFSTCIKRSIILQGE